ncbi:type I phosphodiesterase / nucleotide pyrophosphatase [bacterium BMS3Bbin07]|nr:type I phosphodiesterase / nucleotide pyrophosphatase [bacterium BMS3Bbin07]
MFIAAITGTDRLHHYLWAALDDASHPQHEFFISFYQELDRFIGAFYEKIDSEIPFIMLSDHGFTTIKKEVYLNVYLKEKGYLRFNKKEPESFEALDRESKAFVLDPSRVYIHLKDKFARGCVEKNSYEDLRNAIREDLLLLKIDGESVIKDVFFKEELYNGECFPEAPDIVVLSAEGYDLKGSIRKNELIGSGGPFTGGHTRGDATFYINRPASCDAPDIIDAGVTVLKLVDINTDGLDGNPLV